MVWVENASPQLDAESQWREIIAVSATTSALSILVVGTRLWLRLSVRRRLAADDIFAGLAMLFALTYTIFTIMQTKYGLGLPLALRPAVNFVTYTKVNYASRPFYELGISFFKISLLLSYLDLIRGTHHTTYRTVIWISIVLIAVGHIICMVLLIFNCRPITKTWDTTVPGTCFAFAPSNSGYASVTIVSDIWVTLVPLPVLLKLNIRKEKKIGLVVIFMLGLFTSVCSVMRFLQIDRVAFVDGNSTMLVFWGTIEFNVGTIVSSLPYATPTYIRKAKNYVLGSGNKSKSSSKMNSHFGKSGYAGYQLSDMANGNRHRRDNDAFDTVSGDNDSDQIILTQNELDRTGTNGIMKSVTYTVDVVGTTGDDHATMNKKVPGL
ncbi:ATP synthase F0 [Xylariales sp. PMI_506]|nr:ATP synthase F0 [Xylariales sp. PMI_506]